MKIKTLLSVSIFVSGTLFANEFIDYKTLTTKMIAENKKAGNYATTQEVKEAIVSKDWIVADVRTKEEWSAGRIKGAVRIGRQAPEKTIANYALDDDDNFVKQNLIVICNTARRASIEAQTFRQMGFKNVKVYEFYTWIDSCNPITTNYSSKKNNNGTKNKFGQVKATHCYK
ncbi:MAG: hypothetical protein CL624_00925 [Arcobacter sp.]|nr:hypothetical protein [Arcobacter sp.]|tara:strand:- start:11953 stop:12468 length:516 start_codon:yes stop_codon:yes gene_type:complete